MNAKLSSHADVSETAKSKNSSRNSSENNDASADDSADFHDACIVSAHGQRSGVELSCLAATTAEEGNAQRCKKSSFQITRVVQAEAVGDDVDDVTSAEDLGSSLEGKKNTNTELDVQSVDTTHSPSSVEDVDSSSCQRHLLPNPSKLAVRTRPSDINSRFKIVKIESNKPQRKGRWVCLEFLDPPQISDPPEKTIRNDNVESSGSSVTSPIYYIQMEKGDPSNDKFAAAIVYSDGHPSLEPNPPPFAESAARPSPCSIASDTFVLPPAIQVSDRCAAASSKETSSLSLEPNNREPDPTTRSGEHHPYPSAVRQRSHQDEGDRLLLANGVSSDEMINNIRNDDQNFAVLRTGSEPLFVHSMVSESVSSPLFSIVPSSANAYVYGFTENDASSGGICGLDNKIEQAMDLVKSHLMFAVHEEVELLKDQIKELTIRKGKLEYENRVLRASATQETLEKLHDVIVSQPILTVINN